MVVRKIIEKCTKVVQFNDFLRKPLWKRTFYNF